MVAVNTWSDQIGCETCKKQDIMWKILKSEHRFERLSILIKKTSK